MQGWVKPGAVFSFELHVTNLSPVELGALLWLLALPEGHFHRLGGGKPLGFGSVRLEVAGTELHDGAAWETIYRSLDDPTVPDVDSDRAIEAFQTAVATAYGQGQPFEQVAFIAAFARAAQGFPTGLPIHYPRAQHAPHPEGQAYKWFVANDRQPNGPGLCLPDLINDPGLPILG